MSIFDIEIKSSTTSFKHFVSIHRIFIIILHLCQAIHSTDFDVEHTTHALVNLSKRFKDRIQHRSDNRAREDRDSPQPNEEVLRDWLDQPHHDEIGDAEQYTPNNRQQATKDRVEEVKGKALQWRTCNV